MNLSQLKTECAGCHRCGLRAGASRVVFGEGNEKEPVVVFIGEGPGQVEDETGRPFVGPAGQLLREKLAEHLITEDEYYLCNIVKCRPPGNRAPTNDEVSACRKWLAHQINLIGCDVLVTLGNPATQAVLGSSVGSITKVNGKTFTSAGSRIVIPIIHPAAPLHNPDMMSQFVSGIESLSHVLYERSGCPY